MLTLRCVTSSTASGMNTSARSAVAPLAVLAGGVAVVGPEEPAAAAVDILNNRWWSCCCSAAATGVARAKFATPDSI